MAAGRMGGGNHGSLARAADVFELEVMRGVDDNRAASPAPNSTITAK